MINIRLITATKLGFSVYLIKSKHVLSSITADERNGFKYYVPSADFMRNYRALNRIISFKRLENK